MDWKTVVSFVTVIVSGAWVFAPLWTGVYGWDIILWNWPEYIVVVGLWMLMAVVAIRIDAVLSHPNA